MKNKKCIIFNFSDGMRIDTVGTLYNDGQLDLDFNIEVEASKPTYDNNLIESKTQNKKGNGSHSKKGNKL